MNKIQILDRIVKYITAINNDRMEVSAIFVSPYIADGLEYQGKGLEYPFIGMIYGIPTYVVKDVQMDHISYDIRMW